MTNTGALVLVVDDDPTVRVLMRSALRKAGFEVELAATGEEGLQRFAEQPCEMVMLDVELPDISGHEVCRRLRAGVGELLPIVMVTGRDDVEAVAQAYEAGATDFIAKPIPWALFGHRAQYLHRSSRAMTERAALHARNAAVLGAIPDLLLRLDVQGRVIEAHDGSHSADPAMLPPPGRLLHDVYPAEIGGPLVEAARSALADGAPRDLAFVHVAAVGTRSHYEARIARVDDNEAVCLIRDISARTQALAALARSESKLEQAQSVARMGSWHVDLHSGATKWSAQTYRLFGVPEGTPVSDACFLGLLHADDVAGVRTVRDGALRSLQPYSCEYRVGRGGRTAWIVEHADIERDEQGLPCGVYGTVQDITERKEAENRIARLAYMDSLTGLPNRAAFIERLDREVHRAAVDNRRLALLFLDIDGFKTVNDTLGHLTGDRLLEGAAERLRDLLRPSDLVARLGGDEFTVLLLGIERPEDAMGAAQRIREALRQPFGIDGREFALSSSVGIALFPNDGDDAASLLKHADTAMYHAKELGRDNCQFYSASLTERAIARLTLQHDLRSAIEHEKFFVVFQPLLEVASGRIAAIEALIRWRHPQHGLVPPVDFIGVAESTGQIVPIGRWMLRQACKAAAAWHRQGHALRIAVNLSPVQLRQPAVVEVVREALDDAGLPPPFLELEVTEGTLMDDSRGTRATLQALCDLGVRLALDDFGTGYSSLGYLKRVPVHMLKIDRSFVSGLPADRDSEAIVRAIVSLARSLGYEVTAEGVETAEQARTLAALGCDLLQGYHIGRPVGAAELTPLLEHGAARNVALAASAARSAGATWPAEPLPHVVEATP